MNRISFLNKFTLLAGLVAAGSAILLIPVNSSAKIEENQPMKESKTAPEALNDPDKLSNSEWRERLTPEQFSILRQAATERPHGEVYHQFKEQGSGTYYCAGCGTRLFSSDQKFDSRCGWPSFWDPASIDSIETRPDNSNGIPRTEVVCSTCKGHLGHLFKGEGFDTPTDQRFCINGLVLIFVPDEND
jgi:peptide-methionine (R)-S-oxide reductase